MAYDRNNVFARILRGELPCAKVYEDEHVLAFRDINPQAPTHVLVVPREHIVSAAELTPAQDHLWGRLLHVAQSIADDEGQTDAGYRLVTNVGRNGGQTVPHLHLHLLAGRRMTWPPG